VVVAHENITECKQAQDALRWKAGLLAALPIGKMQDVLLARFVGRDEATKMDFSSAVLSRVATAISEVTCNVVQHAGCAGMFLIGQIAEGDRRGLRIIVSDKGKGIEHPERFLEDGKAGTLGSGLPGTRRLVDRFQIESAPGMGTTVTMEFWNGEVTI
jgi:serine/threonine-protein kinase RsbT